MNNKLELMWYGKDKEIKAEPRILIEKPDLSNTEKDCDTSNMLIHGDNLLALKSLEKEFANKIKCIYIDPPYNTGAAFATYDDNLEHSTWLNLMYSRLILLKRLLNKKGVICIQIDNSPSGSNGQTPEAPYLNIICDEIFGRNNYLGTLVWKKKGNPSNTAGGFGTITESILVYCKNKSDVVINKQVFDKEYRYSDINGKYNLESFTKTDSGTYKRDTMKFPIIDKETGKIYYPPNGKRWTFGKATIEKYLSQGLIIFTDNGPKYKHYKEGQNYKLYSNLLLEHGSLKSAKNELADLGFNREDFETPKPEILIKTIFEMFTKENDLVLDSFLGSGTTSAVAHKMKRKWIGIELTNTAYTHCKVRLDKVIAGIDLGGITKEVNWQNGGGYKFYELAPTLIQTDAFGQPVINKEYSPEMLAAAVAKHEGYKYSPDSSCYWKQSKSEEKSYLYVTTQHINEDTINNILSDINEDEFLLIVCKSFDSLILSGLDKRISIKKIPQSLLKNCEFGIDNYNLNIVCPPEYEEDEDDE